MGGNETEMAFPGKAIFVETQWLADHLNDHGMRIIDVRFTRCFSNHNKAAQQCREEYTEAHIPGAVYIDCIDDLTDASFKGIFYVPTPHQFAEVMRRAGIDNETILVCYDEAPYPLASARFWWTALYFGHTRVMILEGGIRKWIEEGRPLSNATPQVPPGTFTPKTCDSLRLTKPELKVCLNDDHNVIIDCLPFRQHQGKTLNPWSTRKGRIPGAVWLPPVELVKGLNRTSTDKEREESMTNEKPYPFFEIEELRRIFWKVGVEEGKRIITYCGKGDAACTVFLALKMIGIQNAAVYEGSLAEWSRDPSLPMECSL